MHMLTRRNVMHGIGAAGLVGAGLSGAGSAFAQQPGAGGLAPPSNGSFLVPIIRKFKLDAKHGYSLNIQLHSDQSVLYSDFAAGRSSHIYSAIFAAANLAERGLPVSYILNYCTFNAAIVTKNSAIKKPEDLRGKNLAAPTSSGFYALMVLFLKQHGIDVRRDVNIVGAAPAAVQTYLLADKADAGLVFDPALSSLLTQGFQLVGDINAALRKEMKVSDTTKIWGGGVTAQNGWLAANADQAKAIFNMCKDAVAFINGDPNEADKIISEFTKVPVAALAKSRELKITEWEVTTSAAEQKNLESLFEGYRQAGFLTKAPPNDFYYSWPRGT
jgi:ABC-type nitrate/sulfonate/bicarbonate transport system substrate-binding protein